MQITDATIAVADVQAVHDYVKPFVDSGHIRDFTGNEYLADFPDGATWAALVWSGDLASSGGENDVFVYPEEGSMIWTDNMLIPTGGDVFTASTYMNFVYDPKVAAEIEDWVNYICPVNGAKQAMEQVDKTYVDNPLIFPDDATLSKTHIFKNLDGPTETKYNNMFTAVTGA